RLIMSILTNNSALAVIIALLAAAIIGYGVILGSVVQPQINQLNGKVIRVCAANDILIDTNINKWTEETRRLASSTNPEHIELRLLAQAALRDMEDAREITQQDCQ